MLQTATLCRGDCDRGCAVRAAPAEAAGSVGYPNHHIKGLDQNGQRVSRLVLIYVATWSRFVHVACIIDAYALRTVGWRGSRTAHPGFVLAALGQARHERCRLQSAGLQHHSDRRSQYSSIHDTERMAEARIERSARSVGDSYDSALAESINGLHQAEVINRRGPWRSLEAVEFATAEWVD